MQNDHDDRFFPEKELQIIEETFEPEIVDDGLLAWMYEFIKMPRFGIEKIKETINKDDIN
jgi:hypothetical protein